MIFFNCHHVVPREPLYLPKESSFPVPSKDLDVVRPKETNLDSVKENSTDDVWNIDGHRILSERPSVSTRFRILNKRPPQGCSWVDGRLTKTKVTSRPGTISLEVWSSVSKCAQKKAKRQCGIDKPYFQAARQKMKIHDILLHEVEEVDAIIRKPQRLWTFQWTQQCHALQENASQPPRHRSRKLQC